MRTLTFWDYLEELSGVRQKPADLGLTSWNEYTPVRPPDLAAQRTPQNRRNAFVFNGLYHYCWLRSAQEGGRHARSLGGDLLRACLQAVLREAEVDPQAGRSGQWACSRYDLDSGAAYLLLDRRSCSQPRMTVETASMATAEKLSLRLQPGTTYLVDGEVATAQQDAVNATAMVQVQAGKRRATVR